MGLSASALSGMKYAMNKLLGGITKQLFLGEAWHGVAGMRGRSPPGQGAPPFGGPKKGAGRQGAVAGGQLLGDMTWLGQVGCTLPDTGLVYKEEA